MRRYRILLALSAVLALSTTRSARAAELLVPGEARLDRPTVIALGVQLLISGDDDFDATVDVRYRKQGTAEWKNGPPLFRVHAETVVGRTVPPSFAGSIVDLAPDTTYELELRAKDPDGLDKTITLAGKTRAVPRDPKTPRAVAVTDTASLKAALAGAAPGDVITLARGAYAGPFSINVSGAEGNPIVIRGEDRDGTVLDGGSCEGCNVFEIYGSYVHLEKLTLQNATRALRWQTPGAVGNLLRHVHAKNVVLGTGTQAGQKDFYVCDNLFEGRLTWPQTYGDDGGAHASDDGIVVSGSGHVVCHNTVSGFGDALNSAEEGARAVDFYGNEVLFTYDDGLEFDGSEGNVRAFRNRFTNTYQTISFQPVYGGPAYAMRNAIVNVRVEPFKLHALGGTPPREPVGVLLLHNTVVKAGHAFELSTSAALHHYRVQNNLWIGNPTDGKTVAWDTPIDYQTGVVNANGYWPDGAFQYGYGATGKTYENFAAVVAGGRYEKDGTLLEANTFAAALNAPSDYKPKLAPGDARLNSASRAIDRAAPLVGINDDFRGTAPDLGAIELGCPVPAYGPRAAGVDETTSGACTNALSPGADGGVAGSGADAGSQAAAPTTESDSGCTCLVVTPNGHGGGSSAALLVAALLVRRRRRQ